MKGVGFDGELGWVGKCDGCSEWWPLDMGYWIPRQGVRRCRACILEQQREGNRRRRADPAYVKAERDGEGAKRQADRERYNARRRRWYADSIEERRADARARYHANPEPKKAGMRLRWQRHRARLLAERHEATRKVAVLAYKAEWNRHDRAAKRAA